MQLEVFVYDLLTVLAAGLLAGVVCKRLGISLLVGYLVVGALIGRGALNLVTQENHELEYLARAGALLLLFSVGIEFSMGQLARMSRFFLVGGSVQMILVAVPLTATCLAVGMSWNAAVLAGSAGALSSTVLVFKALVEWGQASTPHGRRAISILLFQDVALVPLMLLVPLLTSTGPTPTVSAFALLAGKSTVFVSAVVILRQAIRRWLVAALAGMRSIELVVLFTLSLLGAMCWGAYRLDLPPAIGALAAGIALSGNRLSTQIDSIILPFRESFSAVFFVTLGTLLNPQTFFQEPILLTLGLVCILALKMSAAAVAFRLVGLHWTAAIGMGLGLAQLGEFSFLVLAEGLGQGIITSTDYNRMLFVALGSLVLTPQLMKLGLRWTGGANDEHHEADPAGANAHPITRALVIGAGPVGCQITSQLETMGVDVCLVDISPINLHPFAQAGFQTVAGDARQANVLRRASVEQCRLAVVSVHEDAISNQIVQAIRKSNPTVAILVRCRYASNVERAVRLGATTVISEEGQATGAILRRCAQIVAPKT